MRFIRSSLVTKILVLVLVVYATVTLVSIQEQVTQKKAEAETLQTQIETTHQENLRIEQAIEGLDTQEGIEAVARQKLGMVSRGEIVFYDVGQ